MVKFEKNHLKAIIIVHGKSEKQICEYIKSKLRLKLEIYGDKNGEKSIQITSVMKTLENSIFKTKEKFLTYFLDAAQTKVLKLFYFNLAKTQREEKHNWKYGVTILEYLS